MRILIAGNPAPVHVGAHFRNAAASLGWQVDLINTEEASKGWPILQKVSWHLAGHRPLLLNRFSNSVLHRCREFRPHALITTGLAPVTAETLQGLSAMGIPTLNFLTDDPFNSAHHASWFLQALCHYSCIFSPRQANLNDLRKAGAKSVHYLPFAYAPEIHFVADSCDTTEPPIADVFFAGGADDDRVPYLSALAKSGLTLLLYGGYWRRHRDCAPYWRGMATPKMLRHAVASTKTTLCLVRRMNRDGSCMRTFEAPAMGACMLTEDTDEHRAIFGEEGDAVCYFRTIPEMISKAHWLVNNISERTRLAASAHHKITSDGHTYKDRLIEMASVCGLPK